MAGSAVRIICPNLKCRSILSVPGAARGRSVRCRMCGSKVRVPVERTATVVSTEAPAAANEASGNSAK